MADLPAYSPRSPISEGSPAFFSSPVADAGRSSDLPPSYTAASGVRSAPMSRRSSARPSSSSSSRANMPRPTFTIGSKRTPALITIADLKAHLTILRHFYRLRESVLDRARKSVSGVSLPPDVAWKWFLSRSVWRFQLWLSKVVKNDENATRQTPHRRWINKDEIPPVDVAMIWHTFLLHPRTYFEDGLRYSMGLLMRGSFPLHEIALMLEEDEALTPGSPSQARAYHWESCTGEPWQCPTSPSEAHETFSMPCPMCDEPLDVSWLEDEGTGWAQDNFRQTCDLCRQVVTREVMAVAKFSEDLKRVVEDPRRHTLATMHLNPTTGKPSVWLAQPFNNYLISGLKTSSFYPNVKAFAARELKWSLEEVVVRCQTGFMGPSFVKQHGGIAGAKSFPARGLQQMVVAYKTPGPISIDLGAAAQRHMRFVDQIVGLGWTDYGRFENENDESILPLKRVVAQYHAFLDVMASNPDEFLVPTISIDLAWHTHQLLCVEYRDNMVALMGTIVDHDDAVEQEALATAFEQTTRLWMTRYSIPYSICGCPVPCGPVQKTSAVTKLFSRKGKGKSTSPPVIANPRPDILSHQGSDVYETHPSDHSEVVVTNHASVASMQSSRERVTKKRLAEDQEAVASGSADAWQALVVGLRQNEEGSRHERAFSADHHSEVVDLRIPALGQCVMGIGAAGACQGGNHKMRAEARRPDSQTSLAFTDTHR